jgi:hypothetical protein
VGNKNHCIVCDGHAPPQMQRRGFRSDLERRQWQLQEKQRWLVEQRLARGKEGGDARRQKQPDYPFPERPRTASSGAVGGGYASARGGGGGGGRGPRPHTAGRGRNVRAPSPRSSTLDFFGSTAANASLHAPHFSNGVPKSPRMTRSPDPLPAAGAQQPRVSSAQFYAAAAAQSAAQASVGITLAGKGHRISLR